ncbi:MAG: class I SAM-dependent methyltransferase, partial [Sulfurihydrogenibium sp.]|nr:class I SAM-dependent methyltransferase [Sulfurihydrogenibium sp.]
MKVFDKYYAQYYNLLYKDKDYESESKYIISLIKKFYPEARNILDLGCGTGRHAKLFSDAGFNVLGVDQSKYMLNEAMNKKDDRLDFIEGDIRFLKLDKKFDVVTALFHVLSYQNTNKDVENLFKTAYNHLNKDGLFIFDFWYGPAVITQRPEARIKELENDNVKFIRVAKPTIDFSRNVVEVNYKIFVVDKNKKTILEHEEIHPMRFFFDPELELFIENIAFKLEGKFSWLKFDKPSENDWSVVWV